MAIEIQVPDIGTDEVEVTEIMVKKGDKVSAEQSLITVEGDKASMEIPSPQAGTIEEITVKVGDKVSTGSLIMKFAEESGQAEKTPDSSDKKAPAETTTKAEETTTTSTIQEIKIPDIGNDSAEVTEILVKPGDSVSPEQSLITVEGDKASMEIPSPMAGVVKEIVVSLGDKVSTGSLIMRFAASAQAASKQEKTEQPVVAEKVQTESKISPTPESSSTNKSVATEANTNSEFVENSAYVHATPLIRRLAREFGIDLAKVKGTGRKGRILREDVQSYVKNLVKLVGSGQVSAQGGQALPGLLPWPKVDFSKFGTTETVGLSKIQKISGANLHRNWVMIPHVTQFDEADISELEAFRQQQNAELAKKKQEVKITPLVFIMKAVAKALENFPRFNSSLSDDGQSLILKKYINIGVAVDTPNGLVVPVFNDVNKKGILTLSAELMAISAKARAGKLTAADMQGGCFTISSLGGIGGTAFTPIINAPEVAILGVSKSSTKPVWNGSTFEPRLMLPLSLSYDHRVIDGADGARFITYLNQLLSDIRRLTM